MEQTLNTPEVTVLMPVFNNEKYLKQAIESILSQTYKNFELLIIDDGSTDGSLGIIQSFTDDRIMLVKNEKNQGLVETLNKGIELAKGEFIARMDGDDISLPKRFEKQIKILKSNLNVSLVASCIVIIDETDAEQGFWGDDKSAINHEQIVAKLPNENCIAHPSIMIRKDVLLKYKYNPNQKNSEDWDLWMRMASSGEVFFKINDVLLKYRIHSESATTKANQQSLYKKKYKAEASYCFQKIMQGRFNDFDSKVLKSAIGNYLKQILYSIHPNSIRGLQKVLGTNVFTVFRQYNHLRSFCDNTANSKYFLNFFFPFYHIGGAEKVHAQILESVKDRNPVVFITGVSAGKGYYKQFSDNARIIEISLISDYPVIHNWVKKLLAKHISRCTNPVVFGCNSPLFYGLLPFIKTETKCFDLVHAFGFPNESGPEQWSLPVVERINQRIVIGENTIEDFRKLYEKNKVDSALLTRIKHIPNFTLIPEFSLKENKERLNIIYVGRSTAEKRAYLVGETAREAKRKGINADVLLVGRIQDFGGQFETCKLMGEISDGMEMQNLYRQADILLLTSSREGIPMVIMEAMAYGVVVISTAVGGIPSIISNNETGILISSVSEEDIVDGFVNAISDLSKDATKRSAISVKAYNFAKDNFDKTNFVKEYRHLLLD